MRQFAFDLSGIPTRFEIPFSAMSWVEDGQVKRIIQWAHCVDVTWRIYRKAA